MDCTIHVANTKAVTAKLICAFVFAYADCWFSHEVAHIMFILTHRAYIVNGKKRVILCNNFTGRISVTLLCGICDVSYPTKQR